jgi:hypothetical protein
MVDLGLTRAEPLNVSIHPDRDTALEDLEESASETVPRYAYYRGAGGALIAPTLFSPATTPRIARTMLEVRTHLAQSTQRELKVLGATNIRVNQQQLTHNNNQRVGINRPDLQFDYQGRRYHVEYDTPSSGRGSGHQKRTTSNDPEAEILLLIVP